jgi:hypothetical protein
MSYPRRPSQAASSSSSARGTPVAVRTQVWPDRNHVTTVVAPRRT